MPPPLHAMPLVLVATIVWVLGTAAGLAGRGGPVAFTVVAIATVGSLRTLVAQRGLGFGLEREARTGMRLLRAQLVLALVLLAGAALAFGSDVRAADARCAAAAHAVTTWTVRLRDDAAPGAFVRASISGSGCRVPVALSVRRGEAPAGSLVRVLGAEPSEGARGLLMREASLEMTKPPGPLDRWRNAVARTLDRRFDTDAPLVRALLIADTRGLSPELRERFADAGLVHILSISGLHVAIIGGALLLFFQALRLHAGAASTSAVLVTVVYVLAIGAPPPAVRSVTLFAAVSVSRMLQRPVSPWGTFALGALVPLVDPRTVLDLGWQLSVAGYAAVIVSGRAGRRLVSDSWRGWRGTMTRDLIAGTLTTLATAPLVAWHFGRLSVIAPLSNLAAGPVVALLQPTLFFAMLMPVDAVADLAADAARPLLRALALTAGAAASVPGASTVIAPSAVAALVSGVGVVALLVAGWRRRWKGPLAVGLGCLALLAWAPRRALAPSGEMELHLLDVGQGDAIAIRTPAGRWALVDAGRSWSSGDAGRSTVIPHLRRLGGPLALLVLTHPHADHIGGAASVLRALRPTEVRDAAFVEGSRSYLDVLRTAAAVGARWQRTRPGEVIELDGVRIEFLAPDSAWAATLHDPNEASTIVRVRYGDVTALLTGDAERAAESWLLAHVPDALASTILKVAHHGSRTSTSDEFVDAVAPRIALVSVGEGNIYAHPSADVMQRLADAGATVLRTDQIGTVILRTDGDALDIQAAGHRWRVPRPLPATR